MLELKFQFNVRQMKRRTVYGKRTRKVEAQGSIVSSWLKLEFHIISRTAWTRSWYETLEDVMMWNFFKDCVIHSLDVWCLKLNMGNYYHCVRTICEQNTTWARLRVKFIFDGHIFPISLKTYSRAIQCANLLFCGQRRHFHKWDHFSSMLAEKRNSVLAI